MKGDLKTRKVYKLLHNYYTSYFSERGRKIRKVYKLSQINTLYFSERGRKTRKVYKLLHINILYFRGKKNSKITFIVEEE